MNHERIIELLEEAVAWATQESQNARPPEQQHWLQIAWAVKTALRTTETLSRDLDEYDPMDPPSRA